MKEATDEKKKYELPPIDLLDMLPKSNKELDSDLRAKATKMENILKVFNAGQSKARNVSVEWLNPDDSVNVQWEFGVLGEISPQSGRSFNMALCEGHTPTMRLRYTWSDDNQESNTYEEDVQI